MDNQQQDLSKSTDSDFHKYSKKAESNLQEFYNLQQPNHADMMSGDDAKQYGLDVQFQNVVHDMDESNHHMKSNFDGMRPQEGPLKSIKNNQIVGGFGGRHNASRTGQIIMNIDNKNMMQDNGVRLTEQTGQDGIVSLTHSRQSIRDKQIRLNNSTHVNREQDNKPQSFNQEILANFAITSDFVFDKESIKSMSQQSQCQQLKFQTQQQNTNLSNSISSFNYQHPGVKQDKSEARFINPGIEQLDECPENQEISPQVKIRQVTRKQSNNNMSGPSELKSATLNFNKLLNLTKEEDPNRPIFEIKSALYPPAEEIYNKKVSITSDYVRYGLNMYFRKYHEFSQEPDSSGGPLATNQSFLSMPWGANGCPPAKQENLTMFVKKNIKDVVFCRYGMEYLKSFPRLDDIAIGSYKINLDHLVFQRQKDLDSDNNAHLVGTNGSANVYIGGPQMIIPFYKGLEPQDTTTLQFDSVFESGNLAIAIKASNNEYNLLLQNDINTNGHTQWFYFKVKSRFEKKTSVKFNIINLYKPKSLYQYGMRILALDVSKSKETEHKGEIKVEDNDSNKDKKNESEQRTESKTKRAKEKQKEQLPQWKRSGNETCYIQNCYTNETCPSGLFQIQFTYEFEKGEKEIYFAHSVPYTYSMLLQYLNTNVTKEKAKRETLCHSLAGNKVEYLMITNKVPKPETAIQGDTLTNLTTSRKQELGLTSKPTTGHAGAAGDCSPQKQFQQSTGFKRQRSLIKKGKQQKNDVKPIEKQIIMLTSRVHPGESNASWMMQGLMDTLLNPQGKEEEDLVKNLKEYFEIYIIPMLNVDGVVNGNYRCSLAACDLNRKWIKPQKVFHPPVYYTKQLCQKLMENSKKQFFLYLDFHGHSAKKNIFQYGNKSENWSTVKNKGIPVYSTSVFPLILSKQFDYFNFNDCTFQRQKNKESTARIQMFDKLKIPFVFTLEASFAGASKGAKAGQHFSIRDLTNVGKYVLQAIWECKKLEMNKNMMKQIQDEANSQAKVNDDDGDSEGCSSSEEEALPPTSNNKKVQQIIYENQESPRRLADDEKGQKKEEGKDVKEGKKDITTSSGAGLNVNQALNSRQRQRTGGEHLQNIQQAPLPPYYTQKQNKDKMKSSNTNLKTITSQKEPTVTISNNRQTRKEAVNRIDRFAGPIGCGSLRQSIGLEQKHPSGNQDSYGYTYTYNSSQRVTEGQSDMERNNQMIQNMQGIQGENKTYPTLQSNHNSNSPLPGSRYSSGGLNHTSLNQNSRINHQNNNTQQFSLINKLIKTESIGESPTQDHHEMNEQIPPSSNHQAHRRHTKIGKRQSKQELFQQFNEEIEKSFNDQQTYLDEVFKQTAQQFMQQNNIRDNYNPEQSNHRRFRDRSQNAGHGQNYMQMNTFLSMPSDQSQSNNPNYFLDQFLIQQKLNRDREKALGQIGDMSSGLGSSGGPHYQSYRQHLNSGNGSSQNSVVPGYHSNSHTPQVETFMQLQKLHQMQKLNQIAQMQFFRQQAELLLSQNLSQQEQLNLFQQFSFYQAHIQMQNQQYQMMLNQSIHGNNMNIINNMDKSFPINNFSYGKYDKGGFQSNSANTSYNGTIDSRPSGGGLGITNLANIVMTGEQYTNHPLVGKSNNPNLIPHAKRNTTDKSYRGGFGAPSYSVNTSQSKGNYNQSNDLSAENTQDYGSPKSQNLISQGRDRQQMSSGQQMHYTRNSDGQINPPQYQGRPTNKHNIDVIKPKNIMNSPAQFNEACRDMDRDSKIGLNGLTGRTEIIHQHEGSKNNATADKKSESYNQQLAYNQQQPVIKLKRGLVDFKSDMRESTMNEALSRMPQLIPSSRPIAALHARRNKIPSNQQQQPNMNVEGPPQSFAQILNQQLHDPNTAMKMQMNQNMKSPPTNDAFSQDSQNFLKSIIDPVYQKRFFQTRSGRFTNKNSAQKYYVHQKMHIASSEVDGQDPTKMNNVNSNMEGYPNHFNNMRSPPVEPMVPSNQTRPSSRFTQQQKQIEKGHNSNQMGVPKHHNQSAPNNQIGMNSSLFNNQAANTVNNHIQQHHSRRQQIENIIEQSERQQQSKFQSEINKIDTYISDKQKHKKCQNEPSSRGNQHRQQSSSNKQNNNTNIGSFMFSRPSLDGKQNTTQNLVEQFTSLNTPVLQSKSGSKPTKGFGILSPPDRERQYIPVRQNYKRMTNHGHTKSDITQLNQQN